MFEIYAICIVVVVFSAVYLYVKYQSKKIAKQADKILQMETEVTAIKEEIRNAEQRKEIEAANRRLTANGIDDQLRERGYIRED